MNRPVTVIQAVIIEIIIRNFFLFRDMFFDCLTLEEGRPPLHGCLSLKLRMLGIAVRKYVTNTFEEPLLGMKGVDMFSRPS